MPADPKGISLPFDEAIAFFRAKLRLPTRTWTDIWQGEHARSFVVAGAMKDDLLADFQAAIDTALSEGTTLRDFRKDFDAIVERHGWDFKGGRNWRSRVIFDTNLRSAYSAGRWQQIDRLKERRPWLRYVSGRAIAGGDYRPEHDAWHNTVLPVDDAWWDTHTPPNGWYCRCTVQQLGPRDLDRLGVAPSAAAPPSPMVTRQVRDASGVRTVEVPQGIDPGFAFNIGKAAIAARAQ